MSVGVEQQPFPASAGHCKARTTCMALGIGSHALCTKEYPQETVDSGGIFVVIGLIYYRSDLKE